WEQQVESVEKILSDLGHTDIPRLVVYNKSDLVAPEEMEAILRHTTAVTGHESLAVSAFNAKTLRPMIERAGEILARNLMHEDDDTHNAPPPTDPDGETPEPHAEAAQHDEA
ncbi:MAG: hypothetical protein WCD76_01570, partial [Pyrinomonadaceae bacterium]